MPRRSWVSAPSSTRVVRGALPLSGLSSSDNELTLPRRDSRSAHHRPLGRRLARGRPEAVLPGLASSVVRRNLARRLHGAVVLPVQLVRLSLSRFPSRVRDTALTQPGDEPTGTSAREAPTTSRRSPSASSPSSSPSSSSSSRGFPPPSSSPARRRTTIRRSAFRRTLTRRSKGGRSRSSRATGSTSQSLRRCLYPGRNSAGSSPTPRQTRGLGMPMSRASSSLRSWCVCHPFCADRGKLTSSPPRQLYVVAISLEVSHLAATISQLRARARQVAFARSPGRRAADKPPLATASSSGPLRAHVLAQLEADQQERDGAPLPWALLAWVRRNRLCTAACIATMLLVNAALDLWQAVTPLDLAYPSGQFQVETLVSWCVLQPHLAHEGLPDLTDPAFRAQLAQRPPLDARLPPPPLPLPRRHLLPSPLLPPHAPPLPALPSLGLPLARVPLNHHLGASALRRSVWRRGCHAPR